MDANDNLVKNPDILSCSSSELAEYLFKHRFKNESKEAVSFLMAAARSLPDSEQSIGEIVSQESNADPKNGALKSTTGAATSSSALPDLGPSLLYPPAESGDEGDAGNEDQPVEVSLVAPRSKYNLHIQERGLVFKHPKKDTENFVIASDGVVNKIVIFPKPESCRRTTTSSKNAPAGDMVLLCFAKDVAIGKKKYPQICFQLPTSFSVTLEENSDEKGEEQPPQGTDLWVELLCESLRIDRAAQPEMIVRVSNPTEKRRKTANDDNTFTFSSAQEAGTSTTTGGMPFVKCYHGIQDGVLYPLKEGLLFFKPPIFIPRDRLLSIANGRGAAASATGTNARYFDIVVQVQDKVDPDSQNQEEFTGIAREELQVINHYIHRVLIPAMKQDVGEAPDAVEEEANDDEGDDDDDDDDGEEDDDGDDEDAEEPPTRHGKRAPRRQASVEAQLINRSQMANGDDEDDDDDDEEDYQAGGGGGGGDSAEDESGDGDSDEDDDDDDDDDDWAGKGRKPAKKRRRS